MPKIVWFCGGMQFFDVAAISMIKWT